MKNLLVAAIKSAVTALLLYALFRKVDLHQFWATVRNARIGPLVLAFLLLWIGHGICIFRWRILMRPLMPALSFGYLFSVYCIGLFFNLAFPTVIGGDVVKMYYAGKRSQLYGASFAATFLDRDAGMLAMMMIACAASLLQPVEIPGIRVGMIIWGAAALFVAANVALFTPRLHDSVNRVLRRIGMARAAARSDTVARAFNVMSGEHSVLVGSLAISVVNQLLVILVSWCLALGLRIQVSLVYFLVFIPIVTLVSMIPISLNGMGLREYAFVALFTGIGVRAESAIALGLLSSTVIILSSLPGGVVYVFFKSRSDARAMRAVEADLS